MEIKLTEVYEKAIVREYGSTDYLQTYCEMLASHLVDKQANDDAAEKTRLLNKIADDPVVVAKMEEVKAAEIAEQSTEEVKE